MFMFMYGRKNNPLKTMFRNLILQINLLPNLVGEKAKLAQECTPEKMKFLAHLRREQDIIEFDVDMSGIKKLRRDH